MDHKILNNIQTFVQLLNTCKGDAVSQWDDDALQRAFHWAKYAEKLYSKVVNRPGFLQRLNFGLEKIQREPDSFLKNRLTAENLKESRKILTKILLENSYLPSELYRHLLLSVKLKTSSTTDPCREALTEEQFVEFTGTCTKLKSTYKILKDIDSELGVQQKHSSGDNSTDIIIDAHLLRNYLLHQFSHSSSNTERKQEIVDSVLHSVAAKSQGLVIIGSMLGLEQPTKNRDESLEVCEEFVFQWLMKNKNQYIPNS